MGLGRGVAPRTPASTGTGAPASQGLSANPQTYGSWVLTAPEAPVQPAEGPEPDPVQYGAPSVHTGVGGSGIDFMGLNTFEDLSLSGSVPYIPPDTQSGFNLLPIHPHTDLFWEGRGEINLPHIHPLD
ncbi:palmdelphin [Platysternon megacephalum]|uniref:Palmdelphin n=1 Tax=Platysternon megacephalum TaxID=55544 RepID=A0A4D9E142_9SAUR|nr:palmdelphin [Platysternon megacephalum]